MKRERAVGLALVLGCGLAFGFACGGTSLSDVLPGGGGAPAGGGDGSVDSPSVVVDAAAADSGSGDVVTPPVDANVADTGGRIDLACPPIADGTPKTCDLRTEVCCRGAGSYSCAPAAAQNCPNGALRVPCTQESDCEFRFPGKGHVCCAIVSNSSGSSRVTQAGCTSPAECTNDVGRVVICNPNDPSACPVEGECKKSEQTMVGYYLCL